MRENFFIHSFISSKFYLSRKISIFFSYKFVLLLFIKFRMIDYLVSNKKEFGFKKSCILEVMHFLVFRDFSRFIFNLF